MRDHINGSEQKVAYLPCIPRNGRLKAGERICVSEPVPYLPMVYKGGPLLYSVGLVSLYWGNFTPAEMATMQTYLQNLAGHIGGQGAPAGQAPVLWQYDCVCACVEFTAVELNFPPSASDSDIRNKVVSLQRAQRLPLFGSGRLFLIFTKGISFPGYGVPGGWCGYHGAWGTDEYYGLVPQPTPAALCGTDDNTAWQSVTSHEIFEAMTDPVPGTGWVEAGEEGGDTCNFCEVSLPFGTVQMFADNNQQQCSVWSPAFPDFWVKRFNAWGGYAVGQGYFVVGDFDGDGKADLLHVVAGTDYVNVWRSKGDGTFAVTKFSPWGGYAVGQGHFVAGDLNRDGKTDLVHIVAGTEYVNVWTKLYLGFQC